MKLNEIDFDKLSDQELIQLCLKYKILDKTKIPKTTRKEILSIIKVFLKKKLQVYGEKKSENTKKVQLQRRMSTSGKLENNKLTFLLYFLPFKNPFKTISYSPSNISIP